MFMSRGPFTTLCLVVSASALHSCANTEYSTDGIPFTCTDNGACPADYRCSSGYCISKAAPPLAQRLDYSNTTFAPQLHADPDRGGLVTCWSRAEDQDSANGAMHGAFLDAAGVVHPATTLARIDTRGYKFLGTCAPIPHSNGKILIGGWFQAQGVSSLRLWVWTPRADNPYEGEGRLFYEEYDPSSSFQVPSRLEATVVGDEAWVPLKTIVPVFDSYGSQNHLGQDNNRLARLRVSAADVEAGHPRREILNESGSVQSNVYHAQFVSSQDGAWVSLGQPRYLGFVPQRVNGIVPLFSSIPSAEAGFGLLVGAFGRSGDAANPAGAVGLWADPQDGPEQTGSSYRLAWIRQGEIRTHWGPRLPFARTDTPYPGSLVTDTNLYLIGAPSGGVLLPPRPATLATQQSAEPTNTTPTAIASPLAVFRVPLNAPDTAQFEAVRVIARDRLGNLPVVAAASQWITVGNTFGLAWVEFVPPDTAGRGARYVLYLDRFSLATPG